ncbi:MAG: fumarylacetoacetate hydrolase family protein [Acidobacteria bacterium]|nr:fumarylacetoacetate hydrolase family protein [Acidobacteriota bacterium]
MTGSCYRLVELLDDQETVTRAIDLPIERRQRATPQETLDLDPVPLMEAKLLAPVMPSKIVCIGRNYREHAREFGNEPPAEPLIFLKPPSSLNFPGGPIRKPRISRRVDFEGELGVVISKTCSYVRDEEPVRPYILGYTCVNDVTARDLQKADSQWTRAKGFDTFCPVGPVVSNEPDPWAGIELTTRVNGETRQQANTRDLIFPIDVLIRYISRIMTLYPGDLIATGTPAGVGPLNAGDLVEVTLEGIGTLVNVVVDE